MINKINIINLIRLGLKFKKKKIKLKLNKNDFKYLNLFVNLNIIKFVKKDYKNEYFVFLNFKSLKILNLYKPTKKKLIKLKEIKLINNKKKNIFYLSTTKGLISNISAQKLKLGGLVLFNLVL